MPPPHCSASRMSWFPGSTLHAWRGGEPTGGRGIEVVLLPQLHGAQAAYCIRGRRGSRSGTMEQVQLERTASEAHAARITESWQLALVVSTMTFSNSTSHLRAGFVPGKRSLSRPMKMTMSCARYRQAQGRGQREEGLYNHRGAVRTGINQHRAVRGPAGLPPLPGSWGC